MAGVERREPPEQQYWGFAAPNPSHPPGTLGASAWNPNVAFQSWDHEQWGPLWGQYTLAAPGPYISPFTFYYLGSDSLPPEAGEALRAFQAPYDRFGRTVDSSATLSGIFPNGPHRVSFGDPPDRPENEMAGASQP